MAEGAQPTIAAGADHAAGERSAVEHEVRRPAAFGVMLHLLGAAATGFASLVWAALLLLQVVPGSGLRVALVFAGLAVSGLWMTWLVVVSREWEDVEERTEPAAVSTMVAAPWVGVDCDGLDDALLPVWTREPAAHRRRLLEPHVHPSRKHVAPRRAVLGGALTASA